MCGIHLVTHSNNRDYANGIIKTMLSVSEHRGPDEKRIYENAYVVAGVNRLRIVGGKRGEQPIYNSDQTITVLGNGEIYNYLTLTKELKGIHSHNSTSDISVILHLYEELGIDFLGKLEGQFSFIIIDNDRQKLYFARDRWGITPLFYARGSKQLMISSSIRSIINTNTLKTIAFDEQALAESWILYGPTPPRTSFKGINQLAPGEYAEYDLKTKELTIQAYTTKEIGRTNLGKPSVNLHEAVESSVSMRIHGEGRVGVYVSGGLDSAIIAALVNKLSPEKPYLLGITFKDLRYDESYYQKILASHTNCVLQNIEVTAQSIVDAVEECVRYTDCPLIRSAPIPMLLLSRQAKKIGVKYALGGEGADELFSGYPVFKRGQSSVSHKWDELFKYISYFTDESLQERIEEVYLEFIGSNKKKLISELQQQEIDTKLSRYLLCSQGDRTAMANSIELRFPFLDSTVARIAQEQNSDIDDLDINKSILRDTFGYLLPETIKNRVKKGYLSPDLDVINLLIKSMEFKRLMSEEYCRYVGIFNPDKVSILIDHVGTTSEARFLLFVYTTHLLYYNLKFKSEHVYV